jgi:osmoprotectant transport system permease protein
VVVASKSFAESLLLGELFAQLLEARGTTVDRRSGLGSTEVLFRALVAGEVDVYPEYSGTGLLVILGEEAGGSTPLEVYRRVRTAFDQRWGLRWLPALGFQNTYAVAVRRSTADSLQLRTLSDLAVRAPQLVAGLTPDFIGRSDGLPGLEAAYGMRFGEVRPLLQAVKYQALAAGEVDVIDGYSTDGALARYALVVLRDDQGFFPPYEAAALVGRELARSRPEAVTALTELSGLLDEATMQRANRALEVEGEAVEAVAARLLGELGLVSGEALGPDVPTSERQSFLPFFWERRRETLALTVEHLVLVGVSLLAAILFAVPGGLALAGRPGSAEGVIRGVGLLQTVPSIALLAFMIPLLGIGFLPAAAALFLYSLLPVIRNTYTGVVEADPAAVRAGTALGMTGGQVLLQIRLPLAAPVIMAGIRTAAVINVGTATLAAFIGAGGLGEPIVAGLALSDTRLILSGALPAALLAVLVDGLLARVEVAVAPRGLRDRGPGGRGRHPRYPGDESDADLPLRPPALPAESDGLARPSGDLTVPSDDLASRRSGAHPRRDPPS